MSVPVSTERYAFAALAPVTMEKENRLSATKRYLATAHNHTCPMLTLSTCKNPRLRRYSGLLEE